MKHDRYAKVLRLVLAVQVAHLILGITYEKRSYILFPKGI